MLDLAGDTILFPHPCPQSHCAHVEKKLEDPTFIGADPSWSRVWMGFWVPPGVSQPQALSWRPKVAPTAAFTLPAADDARESQIRYFHPHPDVTHPLPVPNLLG